jgi:Tol biopolymer transport system component
MRLHASIAFGSPPARIAAISLSILLLMTLVAGTVVAGASLLSSTEPAPMTSGVLVYGAEGDIFTMRDDGTDRRRLTSGPEFDLAPVWSPDGTMIAFYSDPDGDPEKGEPTTIKVVDADGTDLHAIAGDVPVTAYYWGSISWAPDSERLAFSVDRPLASAIYTVDADGSDLRELDLGPILDAMTPAWAPDGSLIAFRGWSVADGTGVYVMTPDGSQPRRVSAPGPELGDRSSWTWPRWSADSKELVFAYEGGDGYHVMGVATVDGTSQHDVTDEAYDRQDASWSPDGARLAFKRYGPERVPGSGDFEVDTYLWDAADGSVTHVDLPTAYGGPASWSPDGSRLLIDGPPIEGAEEGEGHFLIATLDGSRPIVDIPVMWSTDTASWKPTP